MGVVTAALNGKMTDGLLILPASSMRDGVWTGNMLACMYMLGLLFIFFAHLLGKPSLLGVEEVTVSRGKAIKCSCSLFGTAQSCCHCRHGQRMIDEPLSVLTKIYSNFNAELQAANSNAFFHIVNAEVLKNRARLSFGCVVMDDGVAAKLRVLTLQYNPKHDAVYAKCSSNTCKQCYKYHGTEVCFHINFIALSDCHDMHTSHPQRV